MFVSPRIGVNVFVALMLGSLFAKTGNEGSRVIDNYNLLFAILIHQGMTTMMLTVLTCKSLLHFIFQLINCAVPLYARFCDKCF